MRSRTTSIGGTTMRRQLLLLLVAIPLLLVLALPAAASAGEIASAKGKPAGSRRLGAAVILPNGKSSSVTFAVRTAAGSRVAGYAVASTRYFEMFNLGAYHRSTRSRAFADFRAPYTFSARLVYRKLSGDGRTYRMLTRVYWEILGE